MRAAIIDAYGATPRAGDFPAPDPGPGQMVVEVSAAGLNPSDIRTASGTFYGERPPIPYVAGAEGIGRRPDGTRIYFDSPVRPMGSFAERTVLPEGAGIPVPDAVDDATAIACGVAGAAAWLALEWTGGLRPGEDVLVLGAGGGVGQIAVQAARLLGARRVVAAARSESALERAEQLGADATVRLAGDDLAGVLAAALPGGVDLVIDPLWGAPAVAALAQLKPHGRLVQLGESAGAEAPIPSGPVRGRLLQIRGHTNFHAPADVRRAAYERLLAHVAAGELTAAVARVPLDAVADAWEQQRGSPGRKLVIVL